MSTQPAGTSPVSFIVPQNYDLTGETPSFAADAIDPATGEYLSIHRGFNATDAYILGQFAVAKGSGSAVMDDGRDYSDVTHVSKRCMEILRIETIRPLKSIVDSGEIELLEVTPRESEDRDDGLDCFVKWRNLSTKVTRDYAPGVAIGG